jgi:S-methylmethionine-dependent homocysteine/selenocysteine methylase
MKMDRELLVLDGGIEDEVERRGIPRRPHPGAAPLPVREPAAVRRAHLDAALAGANVITAMTGGLHRRALARIGDSRRAREWSHAAIGLARDAADEATDRGASGGRSRNGEPTHVRVAGLVLPLEGRELASVSLDASTAAREHRANAAILAEAGAAIARIEGLGTIAEAEVATSAAIEEGLECWSGIALGSGEDGLALASGEHLDAWLAVILPRRPAALLVAAPMPALLDAVRWCVEHADVPVGAELPAAAEELPGETVRQLLEAGASLIGPGLDGSVDRIGAIRRIDDDVAGADAGARAAADQAWRAWIAEGTDRAGGGRAVALGGSSSGIPSLAPPWGSVALPGPAWDIVAPEDLRQVPAGRYRLATAVLPEPDLEQRELAPLVAQLIAALEPGGWILVAARSEDAPGVLRSDGRLEWVAPTDAALPSGLSGWIGRRRP